jgi:phosphatidylserine/phosphatidylglycerophosphate/cardiolipin synthase-like enzyme
MKHLMHRWYRSVKSIIRGLMGYVYAKHVGQRIRSLRLFTKIRTRMVLRKAHKQVPEEDQSVLLWADSKAFDRFEKLIKRARHTIIVQMFIWADDVTGKWMGQLLTEAADRGVEVHIMKETVGDVFETSRDFMSTKESDDLVWKRFWNHDKIHVAHRAHANHAKCIIIDDSVIVITGMNFANEYRFHWHDYALELCGKHFVRQYLAGMSSHDASNVQILVSNDGTPLMRKTIMHLLSLARRSIFLEQAYLSDPEILAALIQASHKKIDVTLILPQNPDVHFNANMESVRQLLLQGSKKRMRVLLYPGMVHGKIILVDHMHALIGSTNLIPSSLDSVGEACVLISKKPLRPLQEQRLHEHLSLFRL